MYVRCEDTFSTSSTKFSALTSHDVSAYLSEFLLNLRKGAEAVSKFLNATYWDWLDGSALLYWRWPSEFQKDARDGFEPCFLHDPPKSRSRQSHFPADDVDKVWNKLRKFLVRN